MDMKNNMNMDDEELYDVYYEEDYVGIAHNYEEAVKMVIDMYGHCDEDELIITDFDYSCPWICELCDYVDECTELGLR